MILMNNGEILKSYRVALGRQPAGRKIRNGDFRTPEGKYILDYRNSKSRFYRSIHISYPNSDDLADAKKRGVNPGNGIMIHGLPRGFEDLGDVHMKLNWTKGCIAVSNEEMDEIWAMVHDGTPIEIRP
jgi:murein L,D-transpeptidase YafK